jgi:hypothetical protein
METGIYANIPNAEYHAMNGLSASGLSRLAQSPAHYLAYKQNPPEQTKSMLIGSAVHAAVLEDGLNNGMILRAPGGTRATKVYKEFAEQNPGKILLTEDEYHDVGQIAEAVLHHNLANELLRGGKAEQSAFWIDEKSGVLCKCRPDYLREDGLVLDLKTSADASPEAFQRSIMNYKYHWQSAWYLDGLSKILGRQLENFVHLVVETSAPYGVAVYVLDNGSLDKARDDIRVLLDRYAECLHTGEWPGYDTRIQNISLPHWAFQKEIA